jgi:hypothetical protein
MTQENNQNNPQALNPKQNKNTKQPMQLRKAIKTTLKS